MKSFKMHEAKTQLSKIVSLVEAGETVALKRRDKVVANIVPAAKPEKYTGPTKLGWLRDKHGPLPDDFDEVNRLLDEEIVELFEESISKKFE